MHNNMVEENQCKVDAFKTLKEALVNFCYDEVNREHYQVVVETCFPESYDESQKCQAEADIDRGENLSWCL